MADLDKDPYGKNQTLRQKIISHMTEDENGNFVMPPMDKDTFEILNKFMTAEDKVNMHKDRMVTDKDNADANREIAKALAANTSTVTLVTRHEGVGSGSGPRALGSDRNVSINPDTVEPLGGDIDIDHITRIGRAATKGQDQDSEV